MVFQAAIHGLDLDKAVEKAVAKQAKVSSGMLFRDPKDYSQMNPEERETLSKKMLEHWKAWADSTPIPLKG
jgi:hypothetical protein